MPPPSHRRAAALGALLALASPLPAAPLSAEAVPLSPEAALAGAVLAADDEGGAGWYNPASLGAIRRSSLQLGASAYGLSAVEVRHALRTELPWTTVDDRTRDVAFSSVPSALGLSWKLAEGLGVAVGVWTPFHGTRAAALDASASGPFPGAPGVDATYAQSYASTSRSDDTWVGAAAGWQAHPRLRLGAALHLAYSTAASSVDLATSLDTTSADPLEQGEHVDLAVRSHLSQVAARALVGLQWQATAGVRLALALRTPAVRLAAWGDSALQVSYASLLPGFAPQEGQETFLSTPASSLSVVEVGRVLGGVAWERAGWSLRADVDWGPRLDRRHDGAAHATWNVRAGLLHRSSDDLVVGAGLFREAARDLAAQGAISLDRVGATAGVSFRPEKVVRALGGGTGWDLLTCVAARVAVGTGSGPGMVVVPFDLARSQLPILPGQADRGFLSVPARSLEGSLHVFTTLAF